MNNAVTEATNSGCNLGEAVRAIRLNSTLKAFERKRSIAALVLADLSAYGRLIQTSAGEKYYFDTYTKKLSPIDGEEFRSELFERFALNPTEEETRFVEQDIVTAVVRRGERAEVRRLAYWDDAEKKLYVSLGGGNVFVLDGTTITPTANGAGGVLFLSDRECEAVAPDMTSGREQFDALFEQLNLSAKDEGQHEAKRALLKVWTVALFFLEALPVRPVLALVGEQGGGKTTFARGLGFALFGQRFDVSSFRSDSTGEQDFLAAITAKRLVVFDNADQRIAWLPDHMAKIATGGMIERRKLYTTNELASYSPDCFLVITSRDPRWRRDDVARRLLVCHLDTLTGKKIADGKMRRDILTSRPQLIGGLLSILNGVVRELRAGGGDFSSHHRLADFHWFGRLASRVMGVSAAFERAMDNLDREQMHLLADGDERLALLEVWLDSRSEVWEGEEISASALFDQLRLLYQGAEKSFPFRSPTSVGTWLGRHADMIESELNIRVTAMRTDRTRTWLLKAIATPEARHDSLGKPRCQGVSVSNSTENGGFLEHDTLTPFFSGSVSANVEVFHDDA